jgi:hypothetical protein
MKPKQKDEVIFTDDVYDLDAMPGVVPAMETRPCLEPLFDVDDLYAMLEESNLSLPSRQNT